MRGWYFGIFTRTGRILKTIALMGIPRNSRRRRVGVSMSSMFMSRRELESRRVIRRLRVLKKRSRMTRL